ncbi:pro-apoptotic serine protease [Planoprotostelium fungivorum]|uniref:Pro-apoptotic serine protease n=1 Tax=Planoprotostelium fungivorum TaxID=1890364 RepID=A0A2P6NER5_9EUKA|nr:pro-apoptotic serine protease [Planoprotostelium fungivorum]
MAGADSVDLKKRLEDAGQGHLLQFEAELSAEERTALRQDIESIDLEYVQFIHKRTAEQARRVLRQSTTMSRLPPNHYNQIKGTAEDRKRWYQLGLEKISQGKVATLLLAGGQGTRLGTKDPKGMYNVGLLSGKSLFQLQAERIVRLQNIIEKMTGKKIQIPWYIMTSEATKGSTHQFFAKHDWFGLNQNDVIIFEQTMLPCLLPDGKIILESKHKIARAPNGNGGVFEALGKEGILEDMKKRGIELVYQYCVDNILVKMVDPVFAGYCFDKNIDCAAKYVTKLHAKEPVGVLCLKNGRPGVLEYSELDESTATRMNDDGSLYYNESHICMNAFSVEFLNSLVLGEKIEDLRNLPFHIAKKSIPSVDVEGQAANVNGWKLELFIFDVFEHAKRFYVYEVERMEEFSPLKNGAGSSSDNPTSCKAHLSNLHKAMVVHAGGDFDRESGELLEVSPLVAVGLEDLEDLKGRVQGKKESDVAEAEKPHMCSFEIIKQATIGQSKRTCRTFFCERAQNHKTIFSTLSGVIKMDYQDYPNSPSISSIQLDEAPPMGLNVESETWQRTLDRVVSAVVAIRFCTVRHFDTERASFSVATGFIVDKAKGLILTNRHVVRPGPVTAEAIFLDHEEIKLYPVYRDPIHDFGFFRFNPADVKFMDLKEIELDPEGAKVGIEIRVVGNDAGEKLSILSGTIARMDRPAPFYGDDEYNDFNTFYYQAASSTSGGSSGSPVLNLTGKAIALNAGGRRKAASSFYLPLHRVKRVLQYLQNDNLKPPRGDLQTVFRHTPYDEVHRLGLRGVTESTFRKENANETGMLVVDSVIPESPSYNVLEPGDVIVSLQGELLTQFIRLEDIMDSHVGQTVTIEIERGGVPMTHKLPIVDLHQLEPSTFLEVGGGVLHELSYQQARNHRLPVGGVYVASDGYMLGRGGLHKGTIIRAVGQTETPNLESFAKAICSYSNDSRVPIQYFTVSDRHQSRLSVIYIDRCWHGMQMWTKDDALGLWTASDCLPAPEPAFVPKPTPVKTLKSPMELANEIVKSMVMVSFHIPYVIDGGSSDNYLGSGLILDAERGLILVDQNTVPLVLGDLLVSFASTVEIPARIRYIHPIHNFGILQYDPKLLVNSGFQSANISMEPLEAGADVFLVGLTRTDQPFCQKTTVSKIEELFIGEARPPRFRAINEDVIHLEKATSCVGGVLVDENRKIRALWASYSSSEKKNPSESFEIFRGLPLYLIQEIIEPLKRDEIPRIRSLEVELWPIALSKARDLGLGEKWIQDIEDKYVRRHILCIRRIAAKTDASTKLKTGDVLIAVNGDVVTNFREVENLTRERESVSLTLLRNQQEIVMDVKTTLLEGIGTDKVESVYVSSSFTYASQILSWSGAILQNTHRAVSQLGFTYEGVFCSRWFYGSPAHQFGLRAVHWIVEVNGKRTPDLESFIKVVRNAGDEAFLRLKLMGMQDKVSVLTIKTDLHYWPTVLISLDKSSGQWSSERITAIRSTFNTPVLGLPSDSPTSDLLRKQMELTRQKYAAASELLRVNNSESAHAPQQHHAE